HVGDSRIYRFREKKLEQLTLDHSKSQKLPYKNILTRAIGAHMEVEAEIHVAPVIPHDIYLMCSDGLTDQVSDDEIAETLMKVKDIKKATTHLVERAKEQGGIDNVTVVMVKTEDESLSRQ
ncbi:MAG: serine/threonine-protein phosphatase, partial [Chlamydiia bacterium]|nr:serine/threonine-protein phosphatase [Chlamydiia bacterium]